MTAAYVDTSFHLAIVLGEPRAAALRRVLRRFDRLFSSDLIVAECLSTASREHLEPAMLLSSLRSVSLVLPSRSLANEIVAVAARGLLRGADLWHVACALFVAGSAPSEVAFLSCDQRQRRIAGQLGFVTPR